jgi:hypothetical protein
LSYQRIFYWFGKGALSATSLLCIIILFCSCANGELPKKKEGKMTQGRYIEVSDTLWYGKTPYSPVVPKGSGLVFTPVEAVSASGPTVALAAAYRVGSPYTEYYGGQLPRAIRVIAVNEETGRIYEAGLNGPDHPPIQVLVSDKSAVDTQGQRSFESSFFNFDAAHLLRLPADSGRYKMFLWLDELVSPVVTVAVPANPARGKGQPVSASTAPVFDFNPGPVAQIVESGKAELFLSGKSDDSVVHGSWLPGNMDESQKPVLWVMFTSHRDRKFGWLVFYSKDLPQHQDIITFRFDVGNLLKTSGIAQKIFLLSLSNNAVSNVHVVNAR